jgi:hypothetical protein
MVRSSSAGNIDMRPLVSSRVVLLVLLVLFAPLLVCTACSMYLYACSI